MSDTISSKCAWWTLLHNCSSVSRITCWICLEPWNCFWLVNKNMRSEKSQRKKLHGVKSQDLDGQFWYCWMNIDGQEIFLTTNQFCVQHDKLFWSAESTYFPIYSISLKPQKLCFHFSIIFVINLQTTDMLSCHLKINYITTHLVENIISKAVSMCRPTVRIEGSQ